MPIKWKAKDLATLNDMFGEVALTTADAKAYMGCLPASHRRNWLSF